MNESASSEPASPTEEPQSTADQSASRVPSIDHRLLGIAQKLHARYVQRAERPTCTTFKSLEEIREGQYATALKDARLLQTAVERGWLKAADEMRDRLRYTIRYLIAVLEPLRPPEQFTPPRVPTLRDILLELRAAEEDFQAIEHTDDGDGDGPRISVTTDSIRLEGRTLGRFRIDLFLDQIDGEDHASSPLEWFKVEALDPNTAANDDDVTHPHVSQSRLCTGDAQHPIINALQDGRLSDFFTLVRSVLQSYNAGSAYIELADWEGRRCEDCGCGCSPDNAVWCEFCDHDFCDDCIRCCEECHVSACRGCLERCAFTDDWVCRRCIKACTDCGDRGCESQLEDGLCSACVQAREEETEDAQSAESEESEEAVEPSEESHESPALHAVGADGPAPCCSEEAHAAVKA